MYSKYQYEKHFGDWKWSKNQKREDWERLLALVQQRSREGKDTDVRVNGIPQSRNKIRRELSRYGRAVSQRLPISRFINPQMKIIQEAKHKPRLYSRPPKEYYDSKPNSR